MEVFIMIDFSESLKFINLTPLNLTEVPQHVKEILVDDENAVSFFKCSRDRVLITNKRIIAINVVGITGKKIGYISLPFKNVLSFSMVTPGTFGLDCKLLLYFKGFGVVTFEFLADFNIRTFNKVIAKYILD